MPASTVRDSLGVTVVESFAPRWSEGEAWTIEDDPLVDLARSGSGDMHDFFLVRDVLRTASGHVVVVNGSSSQIRVYDSEGRFVRAYGGDGDGPGEFRGLWGVVLTQAETLVGFELSPGGRGAEFDMDGGLVGTFRMPPGVRGLAHPVPSDQVWGFNDGYTMDSDLPPGLRRDTATVVRLSEDRTAGVPVASVVGWEHVVLPEGDVIPLMGRMTHVVPTGDGDLVVGLADELEYSVLDGETGDVRRVARILGASLAVTGDEVDREIQARLGPNPRAFTRDLLARLPVPARRPAYQRLLVDGEGNVWAGEFLGLARRDEPQRWHVWGPPRGVAWRGRHASPIRNDARGAGRGRSACCGTPMTWRRRWCSG